LDYITEEWITLTFLDIWIILPYTGSGQMRGYIIHRRNVTYMVEDSGLESRLSGQTSGRMHTAVALQSPLCLVLHVRRMYFILCDIYIKCTVESSTT